MLLKGTERDNERSSAESPGYYDQKRCYQHDTQGLSKFSVHDLRIVRLSESY